MAGVTSACTKYVGVLGDRKGAKKDKLNVPGKLVIDRQYKKKIETMLGGPATVQLSGSGSKQAVPPDGVNRRCKGNNRRASFTTDDLDIFQDKKEHVENRSSKYWETESISSGELSHVGKSSNRADPRARYPYGQDSLDLNLTSRRGRGSVGQDDPMYDNITSYEDNPENGWRDSEMWCASDFSSDSDSEPDEGSGYESKRGRSDPETKRKNIAMELLQTEIAYVARLHLLDQVFHMRVLEANRQHNMIPDKNIPFMFSNIKSIFQLHNGYLLPELMKCIEGWEDKPMIGQVMLRFAPFLKMYTEYLTNFDQARLLIERAMSNSKFKALIQEIQQSPVCENLPLTAHMLEVVQRLPRYAMLLENYLRCLPEDASDFSDTEKALQLVKKAAAHSNETMEKEERFRTLVAIGSAIEQGPCDIIAPERAFIEKGRVTSIYRSGGERLGTDLMLFNDLLLVCDGRTGTLSRQQLYRYKAQLDIHGMEVVDSAPDMLTVRSAQVSIDIRAGSDDIKKKWVKLLRKQIADHAMHLT